MSRCANHAGYYVDFAGDRCPACLLVKALNRANLDILHLRREVTELTERISPKEEGEMHRAAAAGE